MNIDSIRSKYEKKDRISDFIGRRYTSSGVAIVGQDSGITTLSVVRSVLMLDDEGSRLYRYISTHILSKLNRKVEEVTAFNLIDFNFSTSIHKIANRERYDFYELVDYLAEHSYSNFLAKLNKCDPKYLITLGKPVFTFLSKKSGKNFDFKQVFGTQIKIELEGHSLICIPCVHMTTFNAHHQEYGEEQDDRLERLANII